ncbi:MAG TPA: hypothetical protein VII55_03600, partial [Candidatus Saccharimonadales bacterium]
THPDEPVRSRSPLSLPGGSSVAVRALVVAGGLMVLLVIFLIVKGLFGGGANLTSFVGIVQDQQELLHLTGSAGQHQGQVQPLSTSNQNFAATAQLSLTSSQAALVTYLSGNGQKIKTKELNLKVSTTIDTQLTNATAAGTYDQTFQTIMQSQLTGYMNDLKQTYKQTNGKRGHVLLNTDYEQAKLLLTQLTSPTN